MIHKSSFLFYCTQQIRQPSKRQKHFPRKVFPTS